MKQCVWVAARTELIFTPTNSTRTLLLLDASLTLSLQTVCSIAMLTHVTDRTRMYVVMVCAALLAVLAFVGLFTEWLAVPQILVLAIALMLAIELSLVRSRRGRR